MTIQQTIQEYTKDTLVVYYEIDHLGNKTDLVVSDHYNITSGNSQSLISGSKDLSIDGHYKLYINKSGYSL